MQVKEEIIRLRRQRKPVRVAVKTSGQEHKRKICLHLTVALLRTQWTVHHILAFLPVSEQTDLALSVVENPEGEEETRRDEEEVMIDEDIEVVQPTEQWQTLKPGNMLSLSVTLFISITEDGQKDMCVCACVHRPGSATRFPCEAQYADGSEGGPAGGRAAEIHVPATQVCVL